MKPTFEQFFQTHYILTADQHEEFADENNFDAEDFQTIHLFKTYYENGEFCGSNVAIVSEVNGEFCYFAENDKSSAWHETDDLHSAAKTLYSQIFTNQF